MRRGLRRGKDSTHSQDSGLNALDHSVETTHGRVAADGCYLRHVTVTSQLKLPTRIAPAMLLPAPVLGVSLRAAPRQVRETVTIRALDPSIGTTHG